MNPSSQVFFAAYSTGPSTVAAVVPQASRRAAVTSEQAPQTSPTSVESMYSSGACYRVDAARKPAPPPHYKPATRPAAKPVPVQPLEVGYFNFAAEAQSSCIVVGPALSELPTSVPPVQEARVTAKPAPPAPIELADPIDRVADLAQPAAEESPSIDESPEETPWAATWEVDEFCWPDDAVRLYQANSDYFNFAGEKLRDASREGLKVLAISATREKEGCTTLAMCLAQGAAAAGANVALIDGNLCNPELGLRMGLDFSRGWQDACTDQIPLSEAAVVSLADRITLFPLSATHRLPTLNDRRVSEAMRQLSRHFDIVIIDAGALPAGDSQPFEATGQCPVQAAMVVRDIRKSTETETMVTGSRLKALGIEAVGIAENFTPAQPLARSRAA